MFRPGLCVGRVGRVGLRRPRLRVHAAQQFRFNSVKPPNVANVANVPADSSGQPVAPGSQQDVKPDGKTAAKLEKKLGRLERYAPALAQLSQRTGVSLPALTGAFLVLHEVTAVVPVFLVYWLLHAMGVGAGLVAWLADVDSSSTTSSSTTTSTPTSVPVDHESTQQSEPPQWKRVVHGWYEEGARKVERVGRKYGWLGYEKGSKAGDEPDSKAEAIVTKDAGAVADAIAAYVVVKALLPLRLGISLAGAPALARFWTRMARSVRRK